MSTLGDILREQAPEIAAIGERAWEWKLLKLVPNVSLEFVQSWDIQDFRSWFSEYLSELINYQKTWIEDLPHTSFNSLGDFFLRTEVISRVKENLRNEILNIFDASKEYGNLKLSNAQDSKWKRERKILKQWESRVIMSWSLDRGEAEVEICNRLIKKGISIHDLDLSFLMDHHVQELHSFLENGWKMRSCSVNIQHGKNMWLLSQESKAKTERTVWKVAKFWKKAPAYRLIVLCDTVIWIYSHSEYEAEFLESSYNGFRTPPEIAKKYAHLL